MSCVPGNDAIANVLAGHGNRDLLVYIVVLSVR